MPGSVTERAVDLLKGMILMKKSESEWAWAEAGSRETFVSSEGGNREFREYMWDEMGDCNAKLLEPGCMDGGIVGIVTGGESEGRVVYDYEKLCSALAEDYLKYAKEHPYLHDGEYGFDEAFMEAAEWVDYNTIRSLPYAGPMAPIIIRTCPGLEV